MVENFELGRFQISNTMDQKIVDRKPVVKVAKFIGRIPIEIGWNQHIDSFLRIHYIKDITDWF